MFAIEECRIPGLKLLRPRIAADLRGRFVKLVTCVAGQVMDVIVDIRRFSPQYGRHEMFDLSEENGHILYVPVGCAHGFLTLSDSATLFYDVSSVYAPECDRGIRWDSLGVAWPIKDAIISPRDAGFASFAEFDSPFEFAGETAR